MAYTRQALNSRSRIFSICRRYSVSVCMVLTIKIKALMINKILLNACRLRRLSNVLYTLSLLWLKSNAVIRSITWWNVYKKATCALISSFDPLKLAMKLLLSLALLVSSCNLASCSPNQQVSESLQSFRQPKNIAFCVSGGGSSHIEWVLSIMEELSNRGHITTFLTRVRINV